MCLWKHHFIMKAFAKRIGSYNLSRIWWTRLWYEALCLPGRRRTCGPSPSSWRAAPWRGPSCRPWALPRLPGRTAPSSGCSCGCVGPPRAACPSPGALFQPAQTGRRARKHCPRRGWPSRPGPGNPSGAPGPGPRRLADPCAGSGWSLWRYSGARCGEWIVVGWQRQLVSNRSSTSMLVSAWLGQVVVAVPEQTGGRQLL